MKFIMCTVKRSRPTDPLRWRWW